MKCLIIAAGQGSRLRKKGDVKPLLPLLGVPIIERVIRSAISGGASEFYVVIGYEGERVGAFINRLSKRLHIPITLIKNDEWQEENGLSVLKAREYINEPFLLLMADHLFDSFIIKELIRFPVGEDEIVLTVDENIRNPLVDLGDVTKVRRKNNYIIDIGKSIDQFNGFDTGLFLCTPALFQALEAAKQEKQNTTLSAAVKIFADKGKAKTLKTNGFWIDVDDERAFQKAENTLLNRLRDKTNDGPVSRYLNRPLSILISKFLVRYNITPNQISFFSFLCSILASILFVLGSYVTLAIGGIIAQIASIIDGSDGEVARLKYLSSDYGRWFDAVLDRYADAFLLFGLTWHVYQQADVPLVWLVGFLAIIGSFMLSYTADKYDSLMRQRVSGGVRIGRDMRIFIIFLGALLNQPYLVLIVISVLMNVETIRRISVCRHG